MDARHRDVLVAVIREYIDSTEPIGSRVLVRRHFPSLSAATLRNVMADLEEMGYLVQPHTSAGRAPTDLAYRHYVDLLPARPRLRDTERKAIVHFFDEALANVDEILRGTTRLLSRLTRYASLALAPSPKQSVIARA